MAVDDVCSVTPVEMFMSTNLNNKNKTFDDISTRILRQLGHPLITVQLHRDQIYEAISLAIEFFTKYAGYTSEILAFDSRVYARNYGLRVDQLFTALDNRAKYDNVNHMQRELRDSYNKTIKVKEPVFFVKNTIQQNLLPSDFDEDLKMGTLVSIRKYNEIVLYNPMLASFFKRSKKDEMTIAGERVDEERDEFDNTFDYDLMDYRRVVEVTQFTEASNKSVTSLFSLESALASQAFYTFQFSTRGFDLLSFHTLQEFLKTRNKVLALDRSWSFDARTQILTLLPQPSAIRGSFVGLLTCKVEKPIRDIIDRPWVYKYALAQCKVMLGTNRGTMRSEERRVGKEC